MVRGVGVAPSYVILSGMSPRRRNAVVLAMLPPPSNRP